MFAREMRWNKKKAVRMKMGLEQVLWLKEKNNINKLIINCYRDVVYNQQFRTRTQNVFKKRKKASTDEDIFFCVCCLQSECM